MATIPDTPEVAGSLDRISPVSDADAAILQAAKKRLLLLHQLGATEAQVTTSLRESVRTVEAERDARPTTEALQTALDRITELEATEADLRQQITDLLHPPGPFSVPIAVFRGKLIPLRLALLSAPEPVRAVWSVLLPELDHLTAVYPQEEPVAGLLSLAAEQGLLTPEQVADIKGT